MDRRQLLATAGSGLLLAACGGGGGDSNPAPAPKVGDQTCNLVGVPAATAAVNLSSFFQTQGATQAQSMDEWCWAACISMIFAFKGHPVGQARIVQTVYGQIVDFPALGMTVASALNRSWVDDHNRPFSSTVTGLYDAQTGIFGITNDQIVGSLIGGTPLVLGTRTHARVLIEVNYAGNATGTDISGAAVFDPGNAQVECLSVPELTPTVQGGVLAFLASVQVH